MQALCRGAYFLLFNTLEKGNNIHVKAVNAKTYVPNNKRIFVLIIDESNVKE